MNIEDMSTESVVKAILQAYPHSGLDFALNVVREIARETENQFIASIATSSIRRRIRPHVSRIDVVVAAVSAHFGVTESEIYGSSKYRRTVRARWMVCWILRERLRLSVVEIAERIQKDHSSVVNACLQFDVTNEDWIVINEKLADELEMAPEAAE